ncbi:MAG TPA: TIR domain-containing protein [Chitinophagaceae bacterium]|nr:TIR domain-containing protein [Chitinophagaceae bacterium]
MSKKVFISYHFNDKTYKGEVKKWLEEAGAEVISVDENDLRPLGDSVVEANIRNDISRVHLVLILVGNDTHNRPWVDYEVAVARSIGVTTFWIRLPNRTGAAPKEVRGLNCINYEKGTIIKILN